MGGACSAYDEGTGMCSFLVWEAGRMRPRGKLRRRREDNIKMDFQEVECGCNGWIVVIQERDSLRKILNAVMNFSGP